MVKMSNRGVRMPDELFFKIKYIAEKEDRSTSKQIIRILDNYVKDYENRFGVINLSE